LESKISTSSPETSSLAFNFCFRRYPAQLKTGPSGDGATSGVGETMNFIGGRASRAAKSSSTSFVQLRTGQNVQTGQVSKGLASAVTPSTKSIAASEDQAKSSVGVDATLPPGERVKQNKDHAE
jgi:hypothetical protein